MEILNSYEAYTYIGIIDLIYVIAWVVAGLSVLSVIKYVLFDKEIYKAAGISLLTVLAVIVISLTHDFAHAKHTVYEVIVTDYNEVHEGGYEIVEQRGDITVIKEAE